MDTWMAMIRDHLRVMKLDAKRPNLNPYLVDPYFIISVYDPMNVCTFTAGQIKELKRCGFLENEDIPIEDTPLFKYSWVATKLLRCALTNNLYVYTCKGFLTNAIGVIPDNPEVAEDFLNACEKLKLCGAVYASKPTQGFQLVNTNKEPDEYNSMYNVPKHLEIKETPYQKCGKIVSFPKWYVRTYKYNIREQQIRDTSIEWIKRYLQWSWIKFLLPLAADENTLNVVELLKRTIQIIEQQTHVETSLKFIVNCAKCHPLQICGVTSLINYAKPLKGNEIPFRNFRYIFNNSMIQWLHGQGDVENEILTAWYYENDWIVNDRQRNILQTLIYSKVDALELGGFPYNIKAIWRLNREKIQKRTIERDVRKRNWIQVCLKLMYEVT
jgi:hypothetical protein